MADPAGADAPHHTPGKPEQKIDINRMVRYVSVDGVPQPAVVTDVQNPDSGVACLFVMGKWRSDHVQDVKHDEGKTPGTWHWPPRSA